MIASGLALTYRTSGILNFAYAAIAFDTAYVFFELNQPVALGGRGLPAPLAAVLAVLVFAPLLGFVVDRLVMRHLVGVSQHVTIVATVGLAIALPSIPLWLQQQAQSIFHWTLADSTTTVSANGLGPVNPVVWTPLKDVAVNSNQVAVLAAAILSAAILWFLLRHTRFGLESRATVDRPQLAGLRGIRVQAVSRFAWILTAGLAGLAGVLMAPLFQLQDLNFTLIVFGSFSALVVAGMRSIPLAFGAGIALGVAQNLISGYAPASISAVPGFESSIVFILLLVALLVKGVERRRSGGSSAEEAPPPAFNTASPLRRRLPWAVGCVLVAVFVAFLAKLVLARIDQPGFGPRHRLPLDRPPHGPRRSRQPGHGHVCHGVRLHRGLAPAAPVPHERGVLRVQRAPVVRMGDACGRPRRRCCRPHRGHPVLAARRAVAGARHAGARLHERPVHLRAQQREQRLGGIRTPLPVHRAAPFLQRPRPRPAAARHGPRRRVAHPQPHGSASGRQCSPSAAPTWALAASASCRRG